MMRTAKNNSRSGAALLITLFIIMAIVVISLGFLNNSSVQLRTGSNFAMRGRIDYLAQSALTHAKTLITNPQDFDVRNLPQATEDLLQNLRCQHQRITAREQHISHLWCTFQVFQLHFKFLTRKRLCWISNNA